MSKALTKEYLQSFESLADQQKINLSFKSQAKEYKIYIDVEKYRKILANLLSNAFKELVDLHSGTIQVESEIGTGTVFKIFFPFGNSHFKEKVIVLNIQEEQQIEDPAIHQ